MRLTSAADGGAPVVLIRRHHLAGYPLTPELSQTATTDSTDELLETIRSWIVEFAADDDTSA